MFNSLASCNLAFKFLQNACTGVAGTIVGMVLYIIKYPEEQKNDSIYYILAQYASVAAAIVLIALVFMIIYVLNRISYLDNLNQEKQDQIIEKNNQAEERLLELQEEIIKIGAKIVNEKFAIDKDLNNILKTLQSLSKSEGKTTGDLTRFSLKVLANKINNAINHNKETEEDLRKLIAQVCDIKILNNILNSYTINKTSSESRD